MNIASKIAFESLLVCALTFMLSLGHIIIANAYVVNYLAYYFVAAYFLCVWLSHRACAMHRANFGFGVTMLVCITAFLLVECVLHKDEKGCRDWVVRIIDSLQQTETKGNEEVAK